VDHIENGPSNNSIACVFVAAVKFLTNRCLATIGGIKIRTQTDGMGSGAMIYMKVLTIADRFTAMRFMATSARPIAKRVRILPMNQYAS
jgi:hypothetical protein